MKRLLILMLASMALLAGCKDTQDTKVDNWSSANGTLYYSYPLDGQKNVSPHAPIVLAYMDAVSGTPKAADFKLTYTYKADNDTSTPVKTGTVTFKSVKTVNGGKGIRLEPAKPLHLRGDYTLTSSKYDMPNDDDITFTVRPGYAGSSWMRKTAKAFTVASISPNGSDRPFLDFTTINVEFTQPVDPSTMTYGTNIQLKQNGKLVPATLLFEGRKASIDPVDDLAPDVPVKLVMENIKNWRHSKTLAKIEKTFTPQNTKPHATMVQSAPAANGANSLAGAKCKVANPANLTKSPLTGDAINCIPVIAKLLGDTTVSSQMGNIYAQLAFGPHFPKKTPLSIKKGSLLEGGALAVKIGGHVDAGYNSGKVTVTFISDANGFLLPNPYTDNPNAPKLLYMVSNMAFDTKDPRSNGAFTQNLLHVTMVGTAIADPETGVLSADAVSVVEPSVLGIEHGYGILSFHMESYPDQAHLPVPDKQQPDSRALSLTSWVPGTQARKHDTTSANPVLQTADMMDVKTGSSSTNIADMLRPGDPIILTFNKPIEPNSVEGNVALTLNGTNVPFHWSLHGTSLVIQPDTPLQYSDQNVSGGTVNSTNKSVYKVTYAGVKPVSGPSFASAPNGLTFVMPLYADVNSAGDTPNGGAGAGHSPVVTSTYPGFPCVTTGKDLANGSVGYCVSHPKDGTTLSTPDDELPLMPMPANRSIHVIFSQVMKQDTIRLGETFKVEACTDATCSSAVNVPGVLDVKTRALTFTPNKPWQPGTIYRYSLASDDYSTDPSVCSASGSAICALGISGNYHPLITSLLDYSYGYNEGGPVLTIYFKGAPATDNVLQLLKQTPTSDVDSSFTHDPGETVPSTQPRAVLNSAKINYVGVTGLALEDANVGCDIGQTCPDKTYIHLTGSLMADIVGYQTPQAIGQLISNGDIPAAAVPSALCGGQVCTQANDVQKGAILTWIYPTRIVASNLVTYSKAPIGSAPPAETGPQVMRMRYTCNAANAGACDNQSHGRIPGWIVESDTAGAPPEFYTNLDIYQDAPGLEPMVNIPVVAPNHELDTDMHSKPLTLNLVGPLTFLPDGRLQIRQVNQNVVPLAITLGDVPLGLPGKIKLEIPAGGTTLNYLGYPIEN